jgi:hypothetical protein
MKNRDINSLGSGNLWLNLENELQIFFQGDEFARDDIERIHG